MAAHDSSYKLLFSHRKMVADLLSGFVHEEWTAGLDLASLQRVRELGLSHDLREREDDLIWRVRLIRDGQARWLYVYLLLEFQSTVDRLMAVRLMTYIGLLWDDLRKAGELGADEPLRPSWRPGPTRSPPYSAWRMPVNPRPSSGSLPP